MRILVLGQGGREEALHDLLTSEGHECIKRDFYLYPAHVMLLCKREKIDLVVIGPEKFLEAAAADIISAHDIPVFGPKREAAMLETSKIFAKEFCTQYGIPTAKYKKCSGENDSHRWIQQNRGKKLVLKKSGLAGGKGVLITSDENEALAWVADQREPFLIEEFLEGPEASFFVMCDGTKVRFLGTAQDYKAAYPGGPNTGGMGAISPAPMLDSEMKRKIMDSLVLPTMRGLEDRRLEYKGALYFGLVLTQAGPKLLEYNCRLGDPEFQAMSLLFQDGNFGKALYACASGNLLEADFKIAEEKAACVVLADRGYPKIPYTGNVLMGLSKLSDKIRVFHSGARRMDEDTAINTGGRVLTLGSVGKSVSEAAANVYDEIGKIIYPHSFYRKDVGNE